MKTFIFYEEGKRRQPEYQIIASDFSDAYGIAYDSYGPQVEDLYYEEADYWDGWNNAVEAVLTRIGELDYEPAKWQLTDILEKLKK